MNPLSVPFLHPAVTSGGSPWQKITGGVDGFAGFVGSLGIPAPTLVAYAVTGLEFVGGILLAVGLLSRIAGVLLALEMLGTTLLVKLDAGLIAPSGEPGVGAEIDLVLLAAFAGIALLGPGLWSLDHAFGLEGDEVETAGRHTALPAH